MTPEKSLYHMALAHDLVSDISWLYWMRVDLRAGNSTPPYCPQGTYEAGNRKEGVMGL